jgi:hypothetical protein
MMWVVNPTARMLYPGKETRFKLYRKLSGPQGLSRGVRKSSPLQEFDPRIVQAVASRQTDYSIPTHSDSTKLTFK